MKPSSWISWSIPSGVKTSGGSKIDALPSLMNVPARRMPSFRDSIHKAAALDSTTTSQFSYAPVQRARMLSTLVCGLVLMPSRMRAVLSKVALVRVYVSRMLRTLPIVPRPSKITTIREISWHGLALNAIGTFQYLVKVDIEACSVLAR